MIGDIVQPTHLLLILVVALLVLGPKRLPEVGRAVGRSIHDFRRAINGEHGDDTKPLVSAETTEPAPGPADRVA
jgi:sec-independent protein translocase protein TatA